MGSMFMFLFSVEYLLTVFRSESCCLWLHVCENYLPWSSAYSSPLTLSFSRPCPISGGGGAHVLIDVEAWGAASEERTQTWRDGRCL